MIPKVAVVGAAGRIGPEIIEACRSAGLDGMGLGRRNLDILVPESIKIALSAIGPAAVINAAAYTDVQKAESEPELAAALNQHGAGNLARACAAAGVPLVHISTDQVFDGTKGAPYVEDDPVNPLNAYAKSKEAGEREIRNHLTEHVILRTATVFGLRGRNFVKDVLSLAETSRELELIDDEFNCPTDAKDLARALAAIARDIVFAEPEQFGTYHFSGDSCISKYEFCRLIFGILDWDEKKPPEIIPVPGTTYPRPAAIAARIDLDCGKIKKHFGIEQSHLESALPEYLQNLEETRH